MKLRRKLLWVDGMAAAAAGLAMLLLADWLSELYQLSRNFVLFMGVVNLVYASYSLSLARRRRRSRTLILVLVAGNATWTVVCFCCAAYFSGTASIFGLLQLVGEGLFVGGLAYLEWRWRDFLYSASGERATTGRADGTAAGPE